MQLIRLPRASGAGAGASHGGGDGSALSALAGVIASVGDARFGANALAELNGWMPLCWWSVYTLFPQAPPTLHAHAQVAEGPDGTVAAWRVYRASLYRRDASFHAADEVARSGAPVMVHWRASELPAEHRSAIYSCHGVRERLSIVSGGGRDGLLAINLYRHECQPALGEDAIDAVGRLAVPLQAAVRRHIVLHEAPTPSESVLDGLTPRERDVCERLLKGWTHEGIAADLGLTASTVKTYRDRAFGRLGIRYRNELFALAAKGRALGS